MSESVTQMAGSSTTLCQAWRKLRNQARNERQPIPRRPRGRPASATASS
ncbi:MULTISPECIES: hypothetical protein [Marinobacter]|nr:MULTISPECIES: hypothetical protein [Marinobacter]